jgi:hypothetical protein
MCRGPIPLKHSHQCHFLFSIRAINVSKENPWKEKRSKEKKPGGWKITLTLENRDELVKPVLAQPFANPLDRQLLPRMPRALHTLPLQDAM